MSFDDINIKKCESDLVLNKVQKRIIFKFSRK